MSVFSRLFRKAPQSSDSEPLVKTDEAVSSRPDAPDRAALAAAEEQKLAAAVDGHDMPTIARLVVTGNSTKVRQQAARAIDDPAALRQLIKAVRGGNDKSVYRILTSKRDAMLEKTRELEKREAEIQAVSAALERHSRRAHDPLFGSMLQQLESRWHAVALFSEPDVSRQALAAIDRAHEVVTQHLRDIEAAAAREVAAANAAAEARRLRDEQARAAAALAAERAGELESRRRTEQERREREAAALRRIGGLTRKADAELNAGSTGRAAGLRRAIEENLPSAGPLPPYLANQLQQLDTRLAELKDWKSFSVTPKRVELMEEMESLVGSTLEPPALADRIKSLQDEWRTLSKGAGENLEADWQRFKDAADKAYQPCREYFEAQGLVRQENLQRRATLLARLVAFEAEHNWEQPDWRRVITALRESRQQWRGYSPVDRASAATLQDEFVAVTLKLQARLDAEYARNVSERKLLIERAERLHAAEDSRKAIDDVKELQHKWSVTGPVPRDEDRKLWEAFRGRCEAVFQRREQEFAAYSAGLAANESKAVAVCEALERIAALSGAELLENAAQLPDLRHAFEAAGELPRGVARELPRRFERALQRCEKAVAQQNARDVERSWTDLLDAAERVCAFRHALARNLPLADQEELKRVAESSIARVARWPQGARDTVQRVFSGNDAPDVAANEVALRLLCVRAEILVDRPTPPEDQPLRRQYQVQRLLQTMGQGARVDESELDRMTLEWIGIGPAEERAYHGLLERFKQCRRRRP